MRIATKEKLRRFAGSETAAVAMEYGLIVGSISFAVLAGFGAVNTELTRLLAALAAVFHG
ncbi:Flp family type IVb pilin [Aureimonas psammosilenae]|uniref:Flp family type IVb pilin n=1 Tax=Aureimonas psammosilenae TaxID=2495496 RepID=UPI001260EBBE|nr:hypothetical protein [Aureimonas psammosilenae]